MTKTAAPIRLMSALLAVLTTAGILAAAHLTTATGEPGLPVVQLERVVVTPSAAQLAAVPTASRIN
ncbi:MAG: hypothetical protein ACK5TK_01360 [Betaproteobacteria bacterium]